jgi:outer membrane protein assembly factor BamB
LIFMVLIALLVSACQPTVVVTGTLTTASSPTTSSTTLPSAGPVPTKVPTPEAVWTYETGAPIWGTPAISDGTIIFGSDDGNLYAVNALTGGLKWKFLTQGIVRSKPAIVGGLVYFASDDGYLYALDTDSGLEKWRTDIGTDNMPSRGDLTSKWDYQQSSPVVVDGTVFVGSGASAIYAIDAASGAQIWKFDTVGPVRGTPAVAILVQVDKPSGALLQPAPASA